MKPQSRLGDAAAPVEPGESGRMQPSEALRRAAGRVAAEWRGTVRLRGRVCSVRSRTTGLGDVYVHLELGDLEVEVSRRGRAVNRRLAVTVAPGVVARTTSEAMAGEAIVDIDGGATLSDFDGRLTVRADQVVRAGTAASVSELAAARAAIGTEKLGESVPGMPGLVRRLLVCAPIMGEATNPEDFRIGLGRQLAPSMTLAHIPADSPDVPALVEDAVRRFPGWPDLVVLARGGTIEAGSVWDSLELLRCVDSIQRTGVPVMAAVGHAAYTPLVYEVAALAAEHPTVAARIIRDHNLETERRLDAAANVAEFLIEQVAITEQRVRRAAELALSDIDRLRTDRSRRLHASRRSLHAGLGHQVDVSRRRWLAAKRTLGGFERGIALVTGGDGAPARLQVGERIVVRSAARTVAARVEEILEDTDRHTEVPHDERPS
jgi:hypothetical protein